MTPQYIKGKMPNYKNAKLYIISNDYFPEKYYYGSTCQSLARRFQGHKDENKVRPYSSALLFSAGTPVIKLIKNFPCDSKEELKAEERKLIENNPCINFEIPGRTDSEYNKLYYEKHKETLNKKPRNRPRQECECGGHYQQGRKKRHERSQKHLYYVVYESPNAWFPK